MKWKIVSFKFLARWKWVIIDFGQYIKRNLFRIGNKHNLFSFQASTGTPRPDDSDCIDLSKLEELEFQQGIISLKFSKW